MQIWKSSYVFMFIWKKYPENFALLILRVFELFTHKVWEMLFCKDKDTIEMLKSSLLFKKNTNLTGE